MGNVQAFPGEHGQARAIAQTFLEEEAAGLGIVDLTQYRVREIREDEDTHTVHIYYDRYINKLEVEGANINISIRSDGIITSVDADLMPISPEAYRATTKKTLSKERIQQIIKQDLTSFPPKWRKPGWKPDFSNIQFRKYAVPDKPYVIWKVDSAFRYTIDAFTGEILKKVPNIVVD
jgi:hypothetical protein